jgi:hypothetical protein
VPVDSVFVSIISSEEQMRGWLAHLAGTCSLERQVGIQAQLRKHLQTYCSIPILDCTSDAAERFEDLRRQRLRFGTMDLRIAAICLTCRFQSGRSALFQLIEQQSRGCGSRFSGSYPGTSGLDGGWEEGSQWMARPAE